MPHPPHPPTLICCSAITTTPQALHQPPLLWVCGHIHEGYGEHRVPHPRAPGGSILLVNSAVYYVGKGSRDEVEAQPRVVQLPEAVVVGQGGRQ